MTKCFCCGDKLIIVHEKTIDAIIKNLKAGDVDDMIIVLKGMKKENKKK